MCLFTSVLDVGMYKKTGQGFWETNNSRGLSPQEILYRRQASNQAMTSGGIGIYSREAPELLNPKNKLYTSSQQVASKSSAPAPSFSEPIIKRPTGTRRT